MNNECNTNKDVEDGFCGMCLNLKLIIRNLNMILEGTMGIGSTDTKI